MLVVSVFTPSRGPLGQGLPPGYQLPQCLITGHAVAALKGADEPLGVAVYIGEVFIAQPVSAPPCGLHHR
jgi:hypothetical protein